MLAQELAPARVREIGILDAAAVQRSATEFLGSRNRNVSPAGAWILLQLQQWAGRWTQNPVSLTHRQMGLRADTTVPVSSASSVTSGSV